LFCNKEHDGVKKNIDHMRVHHSFYLLDVDCLTDLKGLLRYIAERIHVGALCLFCSKQFSDGRCAQQHMIDKSHCIMNMEDEDEFLDFYDFTKTYENHPLLIKDAL
jgi:pre-60S factor REI1